MILWNRSREYKMLPPGKRYAVIREIATPDTIKIFSVINNALNIFIPATVAVCSDWNLWVFTTSFIAFDIVSNIVDWCVFFVVPHWKTTHASLKTAQTRLDIYEKKRQKLVELITDQVGCNGNCEKCWRTYSRHGCLTFPVGYAKPSFSLKANCLS